MDQPARDLRSIFARALEFDSAAERARYLADACGDDAGLRQEVEGLLGAHLNAGNVLEDPVFSATSDESSRAGSPMPEGPGTVIGPYKLLQQIGEGGMGIVFLAEQLHPLSRKVALKIIKPGMDSRQVIARFEAERQALALMDHPNIARVLDAGATATGRPYFVMELVKGVPITEYCDQARLTPRERLALLVPVCQAIQHAHQKGIIHRDIKPSNVLVSLYDGTPVPKVIDFGVAKAIEQRLTERTLYTHHGAIVGTLEYMSPEQAENSAVDIDTRTDVYALGVLLYELLTGTTPLERHRLKRVAYAEIVRRIIEEEPPRLGSRLSKSEQLAAIAERRGMEPAKLARLVRGELDWIARKALEKDRSRRYASANDLARDLQRYLADEPVEAGPPSAAYRLGKLAHRHRAALAIAGAFAVVLVAATAISIRQAVRATRGETRARRSEAEAKGVLGFFLDSVLAAARPLGQAKGLGHAVTIRQAIDAAEPGITAEFADQPVVEAAIRDTLGDTYQYLGEPALAIPQHERAMMLRTLEFGLDHRDTLTSMKNLANAYREVGRFDEAIRLFREVLRRMKAFGADDPETGTSTNDLAVAYYAANRLDEAIAILEPALKRFRATLRPGHPETLTAMNSLGGTYLSLGRYDDALPLLEEVVPLRRTELGPGHPDTLVSLSNLAVAYHLLGRFAEAVPLFEEVLELRKTRLSPDHPDTLKTKHNLAQAHRETGRTDKAIPLFEEVLKVRKVKLSAGHLDTLHSMNSLAAAYLELHRWADAEGVLRECLKLRETYQPDDWRRFQTMSQLGESLAGSKKYGEAERPLVDGYNGLKAREAKVPRRFKTELAAAASRIASFYDAWGKPADAARWRRKPAPSAADDE